MLLALSSYHTSHVKQWRKSQKNSHIEIWNKREKSIYLFSFRQCHSNLNVMKQIFIRFYNHSVFVVDILLHWCFFFFFLKLYMKAWFLLYDSINQVQPFLFESCDLIINKKVKNLWNVIMSIFVTHFWANMAPWKV